MMKPNPASAPSTICGHDRDNHGHIRGNLGHATFLIVMIWLFPLNPNGASAQGSASIDDRQFEVIVSAADGVIQWDDVAESIAQSMTLDKDSVKQMLPTGSIDLKSQSVMLMLLSVDLAFGDSLSIDLVRDAQNQSALRLRCRRDAFATAQPASAKVEAKLHIDQDWNERTVERPLVLCIHGMKGQSTAFDDFRAHLRSHGFATAAVQYDCDQSIAESAHEISRLVGSQLPDLMAHDSTRQIALVGHSMGGLVAREWVEDSTINGTSVSHVFMVATPNGGSNWASLPPLLNMVTEGGFDPADWVDILLHQPTSKGLCDLRPNSEQLECMAARQRNSRVAYTTIIGTRSPTNPSDLETLRDSLIQLDQDGSLVRLIRPRIKPLLESFDEMSDGKGDGVVSIERAKLAGVDDVVLVPLSHGDMFRPLNHGDHPVWQAVVQRLSGNEHRVIENHP